MFNMKGFKNTNDFSLSECEKYLHCHESGSKEYNDVFERWQKLKRNKEQADKDAYSKSCTRKQLMQYVSKFPDGAYVSIAKERIEQESQIMAKKRRICLVSFAVGLIISLCIFYIFPFQFVCLFDKIDLGNLHDVSARYSMGIGWIFGASLIIVIVSLLLKKRNSAVVRLFGVGSPFMCFLYGTVIVSLVYLLTTLSFAGYHRVLDGDLVLYGNQGSASLYKKGDLLVPIIDDVEDRTYYSVLQDQTSLPTEFVMQMTYSRGKPYVGKIYLYDMDGRQTDYYTVEWSREEEIYSLRSEMERMLGMQFKDETMPFFLEFGYCSNFSYKKN